MAESSKSLEGEVEKSPGEGFPKPYNIRSFERGPEGIYYGSWLAERMFLIVPAQRDRGQWLESFETFPPGQKPASFSLCEVMEKMERASAAQN